MHGIAIRYAQIVKKCWSMGFVSLLTLSFISILIGLNLGYHYTIQLVKCEKVTHMFFNTGAVFEKASIYRRLG